MSACRLARLWQRRPGQGSARERGPQHPRLSGRPASSCRPATPHLHALHVSGPASVTYLGLELGTYRITSSLTAVKHQDKINRFNANVESPLPLAKPNQMSPSPKIKTINQSKIKETRGSGKKQIHIT